jgi:hypothetical protein
MWRGRLPHWRADDETYYVTFKHKRPLDEKERNIILGHLLRAQGRKLDILIAAVLPEVTELVFKVGVDMSGEHYELSDVIEKAKKKAGKQIIKATEERWPPFYFESYDRIIRDDAELQEHWDRVFASPVTAELCEDPEEWDSMFVVHPDD